MSERATHRREPASRSRRLLVHGARGRMGARIVALAREDERFAAVTGVDRDGDPPAAPIDVIIDFSSAEGAMRALALADRLDAALLCGTTGLTEGDTSRLRDASTRRAILLAPNTSLGVAVLRHLVREAARLLPGAHVDIVESHHARKRDAPSGTALALAASAAAGGAAIPPERVHAIRAGDIVGEHLVQFATEGEVLRLSHSAVSRDLFALGALRAAAWLAGRPPGWYSMDDVLAREPA